MGYTHYWRHADIDAATFDRLAADAKSLAELSGVAIRGWDGERDADWTDGEISINGDAGKGEDFETFQFGPDVCTFEFCKTGERPYDIVVTAILLRAYALLPDGDMSISSDGDWSDWQAGRDLYFEAFDEYAPDAGLRRNEE